MTELTAEAEANVKSRLMEFCLVLTYRLSLHAVILLQVMRLFVPAIAKKKTTWKYQNGLPNQSFTDWR